MTDRPSDAQTDWEAYESGVDQAAGLASDAAVIDAIVFACCVTAAFLIGVGVGVMF